VPDNIPYGQVYLRPGSLLSDSQKFRTRVKSMGAVGLHAGGVTCSIPVAPTIIFEWFRAYFGSISISSWANHGLIAGCHSEEANRV
jgi:hypothetical protein